MCGIVGIARRIGEDVVHPQEVRRMCDAIRHRGPDDEGVFARERVGLGMRRLSIIDLGGGHQPIFNEDGSKALVFNGEIYNYRELRQGLLARGHTLRSQGDSETIVHLYEDYGVDCVQHLRGMFAFALWDESERQLVLARDRFGIKPLYVAQDASRIAFSSELKALTAAGFTGGELDWEALDAYFRLGYVPAPRTPFRNVRKLEPGHVLVWREDGSSVTRRYWDVPLEIVETPRDVSDRVREWVDESVHAHLESDVPLAVLLSGGIDSSAVLASMAQAGVTPHAYTARYRGSGAQRADETGLARELAERYGARLTVVDVEPRVADLLEPIVRAMDEPHADESAVPTWLISERVAQDYKVALSGTGGDELFGGYRRHFGLLMSDRYTRLPRFLRRSLAAGADLVPEPRGGDLRVHRLKRFLHTAPGSVPARYHDMLNKLPAGTSSLFARSVRVADGTPLSLHRLEQLYDEAGRPDGLRAPLYLDYKTYLPDDILHVSDRLSMAHSLEVRVPLVDHELVERAFPLHDRVKVGRGRPKQLLRESQRSRLPDAHFRAPKRGFVGPTAVWLRNELKDVLQDELSAARLDRLGFFDTGVVQGLVQDHLSGRQNRESALWALLSFSMWHRIYVEEEGAAVTPTEPASVALHGSR